MNLRAAWLGAWRPPWPMTRGRRWGDRAWALAAIAQAWTLGGREGRWPVAAWRGQRPLPPMLEGLPEVFQPRPPEAWVALLRHGSPQVEASQRGAKEEELTGACWAALLEGDGEPWMALGSVLLDLPTRLRWVALLGAVDGTGRLHLPPFLAPLVPAALAALPPGWWELLLSRMDAQGRLLPAGDLPLDLPWPDLQPHLEPLVLESLPASLAPHAGSPWLHALGDGRWMLDPALRAWGRGWGAAPEALAALAPTNLALGGLAELALGAAPDAALGAAPNTALTALLAGRLERPGLPDGWEAAVAADLAAGPRPDCPPASGRPTWDRLRVRWGGGLPEPAPGYPAWGCRAHPCADPFHWMAEGQRAFRTPDLEGALWAFRFAHAHFRRLGSAFWAERAASNAALAALTWADAGAFRYFRAEAGPLPSPYKELEEAMLAAFAGDQKTAKARWRGVAKAHPELPEPWYDLGGLALELEDREGLREAHDHLAPSPFRDMLAAALEGRDEEPEGLDAELRLSWRTRAVLRAESRAGLPMAAFWEAWRACPSAWMCLEAGLRVLEARPAERRGDRLVALQAIATRAESAHHLARLEGLWPQPAAYQEPGPREVLEGWMARRAGAVWLVHGGAPWPLLLGRGAPPPLGMLTRLRAEGALAPVEAEGLIWRGFPLSWEGAAVGACLLGELPGAVPDAAAAPELLAPWLARLNPPLPPAPLEPGSELQSDGSEPMATVLRDLARVAPSPLPVLVLGPTGSGKELAARQLHRQSGRPGALVAVNCSAFAESLLESELFGHVKGAFTGADKDRRGAIEQAQHGTLFLDEIADVSPRVQSMLLRVLQEREVRKVGGEQAVAVDIRVVAATHKPLEALIAQGAFRQDLLFRLQGAVLRMPGLAERRHEFPHLVPRLVARAAEGLGRPAPFLDAGLPEALARLDWPGNVRELRHALDRALLRCGEGPLRAAHFPELAAPVLESRRWNEATRAFQRELLLDTLRRHAFNAAETADALGLARPAIYLTAKRLGIDLLAERNKSRS
ncbi:MAG: sigma-54-dependent Fis family transcriptional regulator [Holophagaceae bacterium]|nr:sigma-54-dependent Fis family transcriptional regulator [Holophagaceae bacterium]